VSDNAAEQDINASESEVWSAIASFEQILEAMPNDRVALETLYEAYEKIGDQAHALHYLARLAEVVAEERDVQSAIPLMEQLQAHADLDIPEVTEAIKTLESITIQKAQPEPEKPLPEKPKRRPTDITHELSLAWELLQSEQISQEDYETIVHDLTESSTRQMDVPITVLHVLMDRHFTNAHRILAHLARTSGMPIISLSKFDVPDMAMRLLPMDVMSKRGAIVFELMHNDALVALLNPYDTALQEEIRMLTDRPCHFYLSDAEEYDAKLNEIRQALKGENDKGSRKS
jgi:tetratricopeptide (TPR) repeat protein